MPSLKPMDFIYFMRKHCQQSQHKESGILSVEQGQNEAYNDVATLVDVYLKEYAYTYELNKKVELDALQTTLNDQRRGFDDPIELLGHLRAMTLNLPSKGHERAFLVAIHGFCSEFLTKEN